MDALLSVVICFLPSVLWALVFVYRQEIRR